MKRIIRRGVWVSALAAMMGLGADIALAQGMAKQPDATKELDAAEVAISKAAAAQQARSLIDATARLREVHNCIVGKDDATFDKSAGDACRGKGVMTDIKAMMGQDLEYDEAYWLGRLSEEAAKANNLQRAKAAARIIEKQLKELHKM